MGQGETKAAADDPFGGVRRPPLLALFSMWGGKIPGLSDVGLKALRFGDGQFSFRLRVLPV